MFTFPNKAEFGQIVQPDLKKYNGRLILYGAGKVAEVVDYVLRQRGIEYLCYCDTYRAGGTHNGHPVISPEVLRDEYAGVPVLITTIHHRSVAESLSEYGPREILDSVPLLVEVDFSGWGNSGEKMTEEWAVRTVTSYLTTMLSAKTEKCFQELTVYVTQKCNLRCIDCSAMIPYYQNPVHYDVDTIIRSLQNLFSCDGVRFQELSILGGETLLYPELLKIIEFALTIEQVQRISIVTNGTLLPKPELLPAMQDPRFFVRISDYGKLSVKKDALIAMLKENGIRYELDNYSVWYENRHPVTAPCSEEEATARYRECRNILYLPLRESKLFKCCKAPQLTALGVGKASSDNCIDCLEPEGLQERVEWGLRHFAECDHFDLCHLCSGLPHIHPDKMVPPAQQASGTLYLENI